MFFTLIESGDKGIFFDGTRTSSGEDPAQECGKVEPSMNDNPRGGPGTIGNAEKIIARGNPLTAETP